MRIKLTRGLFAVVDKSDFERLNKVKWHALKATFKGRVRYYAGRSVRKGGKRAYLFMHRCILESSQEVDHKDGDGLNNRRSNLRTATKQQNQGNRIKTIGTTSRLKGVYWDKDRHKWVAQINIKGKHKLLGRFWHERFAHQAYMSAAREAYGEFASAG